MKNKPPVILKLNKVVVGYSKFTTPDKFNPQDKEKYRGCINLVKDSKEHKEAMKAIGEALLSEGMTGTTKEELYQKFAAQKIKIPKEEKYQKNEEGQEIVNLWMASEFMPHIYVMQVVDSKRSWATYKDRESLPKSVFIGGGDLVNIQAVVKFFPNYGNLAIYPQKIALLKAGNREDAAWVEDLKEADEEFGQGLYS